MRIGHTAAGIDNACDKQHLESRNKHGCQSMTSISGCFGEVQSDLMQLLLACQEGMSLPGIRVQDATNWHMQL